MKHETDSERANRELIQQFFLEIVDRRSPDLARFFSEDCVIHRAELERPLVGLVELGRFMDMARESLRDTTTEILSIVSNAETVIAHLEHAVTFRGELATPFGPKNVRGRSVKWAAFARFRMAHGKIAEEWIVRDEVGIFRQLGILDELIQVARRS